LPARTFSPYFYFRKPNSYFSVPSSGRGCRSFLLYLFRSVFRLVPTHTKHFVWHYRLFMP